MPAVPIFLSTRTPNGIVPQDVPGLHHPWLLNKRSAALKRFLKNGLPTPHDEDWRYTNLNVMNAHALERAEPAADFKLPPPLIDQVCGRAVFVNGILSASLSQLDQLPKGLTVISLRMHLEKNHVRDDFFPGLDTGDSWHDLNTALFDDGALIDVAAGVQIDHPLEVICLSTRQAKPITYHACNIIRLGKGAALKIYKSKLSDGGATVFSTHMNHIMLEDGAALERVVLGEHPDSAVTFIHDEVTLRTNAVFKKIAINLGGKITRQKTTLQINGEGADAQLHGLTHTSRDGTTDVVVDMRHNAPHSSSRQMIRSLATDSSRAVFQGKIMVAPHAQKTNAAQQHQGMLLSDKAEIDAKPSLEIYADDVKCSHGNTCGALDETALFYLRSRGIPLQEAQALLQQAFIAELFDACDDALRDTLLARIATRISTGAA